MKTLISWQMICYENFNFMTNLKYWKLWNQQNSESIKKISWKLWSSYHHSIASRNLENYYFVIFQISWQLRFQEHSDSKETLLWPKREGHGGWSTRTMWGKKAWSHMGIVRSPTCRFQEHSVFMKEDNSDIMALPMSSQL